MSVEQFIEIEDQGKLAAVLHLPRVSKQPCPIIIFCPGKNGERSEVHRMAVKYARKLARQGIAFLRFDYYGMGLSDGNYYDVTISGKVSNLIKVHQYVRNLAAISPEQIIYLGFSDGARIALLASSQTGVNKIIFWSPLFYEIGGSTPYQKKRRFIRHSDNREKIVMPWGGLWVNLEFYLDLQRLDIHTSLQNYWGRSLLIYSDNDPLVVEEFEVMQTSQYAIYQDGSDHKVEIIHGGGHLFSSIVLERKVLQKTSNWLKSQGIDFSHE